MIEGEITGGECKAAACDAKRVGWNLHRSMSHDKCTAVKEFASLKKKTKQKLNKTHLPVIV